MTESNRPPHKVEVTEYRAKTGPLNFDEDVLVNNLVQLVHSKQFRTAWNLLTSNVDPEHVRFYNAGVILEHLSVQYGDIGDLKDECLLKTELERHSSKVIELL